MTEDKKELLFSYIKANVAPILVDFITSKDVKNAIVLPASISSNNLNGYYEETEFLPPQWLREILNSKDAKILVIDNIDSISKEEQLKFSELLEHRKISTFNLPDNCVIIVTAKNINKDTINEEIFSLLARI